MNVIWNRRSYVFELVETNVPAVSILLEAPRRPSSASGLTSSVSSTQLLGLLQMAKAYPLLAQHHPSAVQEVSVVQPRRVCDYGDFRINVEQVFRFDAPDTLVFQLLLVSKTNSVVRYRPSSFAARVGERLFHQSISDASGVIPSNSQQPAWFAITGAPDGSRNDLSLKNDFIILVTRETKL